MVNASIAEHVQVNGKLIEKCIKNVTLKEIYFKVVNIKVEAQFDDLILGSGKR